MDDEDDIADEGPAARGGEIVAKAAITTRRHLSLDHDALISSLLLRAAAGAVSGDDEDSNSRLMAPPVKSLPSIFSN